MDLNPAVLVQYGIVGVILVALFWGISKGSLIPKSQHLSIVQLHQERYDEMKEDRNYWRAESVGKAVTIDRTVGTLEHVVKQNGNGE